ncbi:twin-arginine translocase subunit TatB [Acinetobacter sp. S40]|uniref:Sec-independent protein translocase protein TatB n=1 Tax=Acinetobacter sp. S40 TaxID=2767434 RepID=UPI00190A16ED|nr:Sec-independent protein translocase protein TatB [Acinetobacter sp. S40]MBJ9984268.1 twin-arginine translocase subunit TatB [Acinetobacter sp. S40]
MLNVGMTEILCFAVIAILVLGPDKLPEAARFAGRWYARIKRHISNIQNEIDRELKISEFRKEMQDELDRIEALERKVQSQLEEIQKRKLSELEHISQNHKEKQNIVRVYSFISTAVYIPFQTWRLQEHTGDSPQMTLQQTTPIKLKIAV